MFDALSKEVYSLKQESWKDMAEFGVHLSQQVQILQFKYPGSIQQDHVKEMEWDYFYKGLNPEYDECWPIMLMESIWTDTLTCSKLPKN